MAKKIKYSPYGATEYHEKRTKRSRSADESRTAKDTKKNPTKAWYKNPGRSDVLGVDTKKIKAKNVNQPINFLQSSLRKHLPNKDVMYATDKKAVIIHTNSEKTLQKVVNVRFNNVRVFKRKKKGRPNDYWVSVLKK